MIVESASALCEAHLIGATGEKAEMKTETINIVANAVRGFNVRVTAEEGCIRIADVNGDRTIKIYVEEYRNNATAFEEFIVCFATQHRHYEDIEDAVEFAAAILRDEVLPIEFYMDEKACFGGDITRAELVGLSLDKLAKQFCCAPEQLIRCELEVHSWSGKYDLSRRSAAELQRD